MEITVHTLKHFRDYIPKIHKALVEVGSVLECIIYEPADSLAMFPHDECEKDMRTPLVSLVALGNSSW